MSLPRITWLLQSSPLRVKGHHSPLALLLSVDFNIDEFVAQCLCWPAAHYDRLFFEIALQFKQLLFRLHSSGTFKSASDFTPIVEAARQSTRHQLTCADAQLVLHHANRGMSQRRAAKWGVIVVLPRPVQH